MNKFYGNKSSLEIGSYPLSPDNEKALKKQEKKDFRKVVATKIVRDKDGKLMLK